jgi:enoyl-CoA hydratase
MPTVPGADEPVLLLERRGDILLVTLNRPRKGNSLSNELMAALGQLVANLRRSSAEAAGARAVVLTGSGTTAFSAGADIHNLVGLTKSSATDQMRSGQVIFDMLEDAPQVIIAAINGVAFGGGLELAMACDLRIAAEGARLGQPEITLGNLPGWGGTQRLPRLIGEGRALEMILTGEPITAERAVAMGLVNSVADDPVAAAIELAGRIIDKSATAVDSAKQAVYAGVRHGITRGLETEAALVGACSVSPEQRAAVQAFFDRKKPATTQKDPR